MVPMNHDEALRVLADYRGAREHLHEAVRTAHQGGTAQAEIARLSGLTRMGIHKILKRDREATVPTTTVVKSWTDWYPADYFGDFSDDYDHVAIGTDYLAAINEQLPDRVTFHAGGDLIAELDAADTARDLDLTEIAEGIDFGEIAARHDRTNTEEKS